MFEAQGKSIASIAFFYVHCKSSKLVLKYILLVGNENITRGRGQLKTLATNIDQKSIKTVFLIAICRPTGDKWQSKTLFLSILIYVPR